jgi:hypothetical protein
MPISLTLARLSSISVILLTLAACGKDKGGPKDTRPASPTVSIPGGLNETHRLVIAPEGTAPVSENSTVASYDATQARADKIVVENAVHIKIQSVSCQEGVCSIEYQQTERPPLSVAVSFTYHIVDSNGQDWKSATALVQAEVLDVTLPPSFVPVFNDKTLVKVPISIRSQAQTIRDPEILNASLVGGQVQSSCTKHECQFEVEYRDNTLRPLLQLQLATATHQFTYSIAAEDERIDFLPRERSLVEGESYIKIAHGVDYISTWKRPLHAVHSAMSPGIYIPGFTCSTEACLAKTSVYNFGSLDLEWSPAVFSPLPYKGTMRFSIVKPEIQPLLTDAIVDAGGETEITFKPGEGYSSPNGTIPTQIVFPNYSASISVSGGSCDQDGICKAKIRYYGKEPFLAVEYYLARWTYSSPRQTLKLTPRIFAQSTSIIVWDDGSPTFDITLRPGMDHDYTAVGGELAQSISIIDSATSIRPADSELTATNRDKIFQCHSDGVCQGTFKKLYSSLKSSEISLRIHTATSSSAIVYRTIEFKKDEFKSLHKMPFHLAIGDKTPQAGLESFDINLEHGKDYASKFPAEKVIIREPVLGVTIENFKSRNDNTLVADCSEQGSCRIKGNFSSLQGSKQLEFKLINKYGEGAFTTLRLVARDFATFHPVVSRINFTEEGTRKFTFQIQKDSVDGYLAEKPARTLRITGFSKLLPIKGEEQGVGNTTVFDYPCDTDGTCQVSVELSSTGASLTFHLIGADNERSIDQTVTIAPPAFFASDFTMKIPTEELVVPIAIEHWKDGVIDLTIEGELVKSFQLKECGWICRGTVVLSRPLKEGESTAIGYTLHRTNSKSNQSRLTLQAGPTIRIKPELSVAAQKQEDGTWLLNLNVSHFTGAPETIIRQLLRIGYIQFELNDKVVQLEPAKCNVEGCDYLFQAVNTTEATRPVMKIKPVKSSSTFVAAGEFLLVLEP